MPTKETTAMHIYTVSWNDTDSELWADSQGEVVPFAATATLSGAWAKVAEAIRSDLSVFWEDEDFAEADERQYAEALADRGDLDLIRAVAYGDWDAANDDLNKTVGLDPERWPLEPGTYRIVRLEVEA